MSKVTLGRTVHFNDPAFPGHAGTDNHAAIVTRVNDDETVNLYVFGSGGGAFHVPNVPKQQKGQRGWFWPPRDDGKEEKPEADPKPLSKAERKAAEKAAKEAGGEQKQEDDSADEESEE